MTCALTQLLQGAVRSHFSFLSRQRRQDTTGRGRLRRLGSSIAEALIDSSHPSLAHTVRRCIQTCEKARLRLDCWPWPLIHVAQINPASEQAPHYLTLGTTTSESLSAIWLLQSGGNVRKQWFTVPTSPTGVGRQRAGIMRVCTRRRHEGGVEGACILRRIAELYTWSLQLL